MEWSFLGTEWSAGAGQAVRVMGIVNVTPDSFSDGGRYVQAEAAIAHGGALFASGADIVDVGGESSRPGAELTPAEVEAARVLPVVEALAAGGRLVSVDTVKAIVAEAALARGAALVNDISALGDPRMAEVVARGGAGLVLMHMRGTPRTMQVGDLSSPDIVGAVIDFLGQRIEAAVAAGVPRAAIAVDPGIGFGKTVAQNLALLAALPRLRALGQPVVVGLSRKSFLGALTERPVGQREAATSAAHALCVAWGADVLRAHDAAAARDAVRVALALRAAGEETQA